MESSTPRDQGRKARGLIGLTFFLFSILVLRLFYLQVTTSADYARDSEENRIAQKRVKAPRGLIYARDGEVLARSRAFYTVSLMRSTRQDYEAAVHALKAAIGDADIDIPYSRKHRTIRLKRDVDFRTVSIVEEKLADWPLEIEIEAQRAYPESTLAAHLLGYMGILHSETPLASSGKTYVPGDFIGKTGLEKVYEDSLRGRDGVLYVEVDAAGRVRRDFPERDQYAQPGADLYLTIDIEVQRAAERALPDSLAGAVVALDPRTGALLALASKPTFDPNIFVSFQSQEDRQRVLQSETTLLNRALRGRYPPGSTLKMIAAIAALEAGITDTLSAFAACAGSLHVGDVVFRCYKRTAHGGLNLMQALEVSCNIYFHHLGQLLGFDSWRLYAERFGFGQPTGIHLEPEESAGLLPTRKYYQERDGWSMGHLLNLVIGQGALLVTPIQMARYAAAIGNEGWLVTPYVCGEAPPRQRIEGVSPSSYKIVKKAMRRVVYGERGTGHRARIEGIDLAGKTGTAQVPNRDNDDAWFVAFAPVDNPEIAVAVVVEAGGGGGAMAAPVARQVIEAYFARQASGPKVEELPTPADGWALR